MSWRQGYGTVRLAKVEPTWDRKILFGFQNAISTRAKHEISACSRAEEQKESLWSTMEGEYGLIGINQSAMLAKNVELGMV